MCEGKVLMDTTLSSSQPARVETIKAQRQDHVETKEPTQGPMQEKPGEEDAPARKSERDP